MGIFKDFTRGITDELGLTDSGSSDRAIGAQTDAANKANALLKQQYDESKERYQPWIDSGLNSFNNMSSLANGYQSFSNADIPMRNHNGVFTMADFKADPSYQFRLSEGQKAIERGASTGGRLNSGATMKALTNYSQNVASNEYQNAYNRFNQDYSNAYNRYNNDKSTKFNYLNSIANYGQNANNALAGQGSMYSQGVASNQIGLGNSIASAELNRGNDLKDLWKMGMGNMSQGLSMAAMAGGCWVARAVFGEDNPKWREARVYILGMGPKWFTRLYTKHGEAFAEKVKESKVLKVCLRPFFEYFAFRGRGALDMSKRYYKELIACNQ